MVVSTTTTVVTATAAIGSAGDWRTSVATSKEEPPTRHTQRVMRQRRSGEPELPAVFHAVGCDERRDVRRRVREQADEQRCGAGLPHAEQAVAGFVDGPQDLQVVQVTAGVEVDEPDLEVPGEGPRTLGRADCRADCRAGCRADGWVVAGVTRGRVHARNPRPLP
jgi:hypothetical protein